MITPWFKYIEGKFVLFYSVKFVNVIFYPKNSIVYFLNSFCVTNDKRKKDYYFSQIQNLIKS